jgi:hypothetical protein
MTGPTSILSAPCPKKAITMKVGDKINKSGVYTDSVESVEVLLKYLPANNRACCSGCRTGKVLNIDNYFPVRKEL